MAELEIKVDNDTENKLVQRREITATASYKGQTPDRETVKQQLCKMLSLKPDASTVVRIGQSFGSQSSSILMHSYATKEAMERMEPKDKKAAKAAAPAAAPAPKAEEAKVEKK